MTIWWNQDAAARAGLTAHDLLLLARDAEDDSEAVTVARTRRRLLPESLSPDEALDEVDEIVHRHPDLFYPQHLR